MPINALYPLRIIGLNQDEKVSGGMAGLTFQFMQSVGNWVMGKDGSNTNSGGYPNTYVREQLASLNGWGDPSCANIKAALATVNKYSYTDYQSSSTCPAQGEQLFLLSAIEYGGYAQGDKTDGVGISHNESYLYYGYLGSGATSKRTAAWTRTLYLGNQWNYYYFGSSGDIGSQHAANEQPIYPAFCF